MAKQDTINLGDAVELRYSELTAKVVMTLDDSIALSEALGRRILQLSPQPDMVIGLANGGTLPAIVAARSAGIACTIVRFRRKSSAVKLRLKFLIGFLRYFPTIVNKVRNRLKYINLFQSNPHEFDEMHGLSNDDVSGRHVVIVDDCIDTGASVARIRDNLLANGAASVQIAVICWATKYDSQALHNVTPDAYQHRIIHIYPWSLNNHEYERFTGWLVDQGQTLWT
ncbi:MAG: phosphoribosyltransferase [Azonexus sp.]|nr:phosphoribosyltransferase [Erythrobacter sp.]MDZ4315217.1 phosphoribosyltransferase [Azonexus sp.]